jgi:hypothetical protein
MTLSPRQLQFRCAVGFALNAALWIAQSKLMRETGNFEVDVVPTALIGLLAGAAVLPGAALLRHGNHWQKAVGVAFCILPAWSLFLIGYWAVSKW